MRGREEKRTVPVTESWIPTCAGQRRWLRGRDLNPRPLGYEPSKSMARLSLSITYVHDAPPCSMVFWGILFSICSRFRLELFPNYSANQLIDLKVFLFRNCGKPWRPSESQNLRFQNRRKAVWTLLVWSFSGHLLVRQCTAQIDCFGRIAFHPALRVREHLRSYKDRSMHQRG